jgi:hypothetical protein
VHRGVLGNAGLVHRRLELALQPLRHQVRIFAFERVRQFHAGQRMFAILFVHVPYLFQLIHAVQMSENARNFLDRQHHRKILIYS